MPGLSTGYVLPVLLSCVSSLCALLSKIWGGGGRGGGRRKKKIHIYILKPNNFFDILNLFVFFFFWERLLHAGRLKDCTTLYDLGCFVKKKGAFGAYQYHQYIVLNVFL